MKKSSQALARYLKLIFAKWLTNILLLNKEFDEMCAPFGVIDKVEEIFKNVNEIECNSCKAISLLTVTKCPNCGMQFENGV